MPNLVENAVLPQAYGLHVLRSLSEISARGLDSAASLGGELIQSVGNVVLRARPADPDHGNDVSSVRLQARLASSLSSWPSDLRIDLLDGRTTQSIGASSAKKMVAIHVRGDRCFSKNPEITRENNPGMNFTDCLMGFLADHEIRQVLDLSEPGPLPDDKVLDEKLRLLLGVRLHLLLQADSDISQWARSDGSRSLAKQAVIDLGLILSTFAAITGVSWAGAPTIADIQVPGLPVTTTAGGGPLAAMLLAGSVTMGVLAKLYQTRHREPMDANAALIELLFGDRLNEKQRGILLEKVGPHMASLTPALLVTNVYNRLDSSSPAQDVETTLRRLPVADWARAAEHNSHSFDPAGIGRPSDMAAAFESFASALWGSQEGSGKPIAERLLNAFGLSVPVRASYAESSLHRQLNSLENQLKESGDKDRRPELKRSIWNVRHDAAMHRGATAEEIGKLRQQHDRHEHKDELRIQGIDAYIKNHCLHDTNGSKRGYQNSTTDVPVEPSSTSTSSIATPSASARKNETSASGVHWYMVDGAPDIHTGSTAGALTVPGEVVSSLETTSFIFPGASTAALRPSPISLQATAPGTVVNVALLSGRAYQLQMRRETLEQAIPGWMEASSADREEVRASLAAYAAMLPALSQFEKDAGAIPNDMADYLQRHIQLHFGLSVDPRNATLHSQTWRTQEKWAMGSHPVPIYHSGPPQKTDANRTLWEAAQGNFQDDEGSSEFLRGGLSAQHVSISQGATDTVVTGRTISEWVNLIRREDLGKEAQSRLDRLLESAKPALLGSYPLALKASLDVAKLSAFPASSAELLDKVLEKPDERPTTLSGRQWQINPPRMFGAEMQALVFHTDGLGGDGRGDTHADGGALYLPNLGLKVFSTATELGDIFEEYISTASGRELLAELVPLDMRASFIRRAEAAAASGGMRNAQIELGQSLKGNLWDAMYAREKAFRKRNLNTLIKPTADVNRDATIAQNVALYQAAMGMISSFSGLPLIGPAFIGANLAAFASATMEYTQLRRQEGSKAADALLPDLFTSLLSAVDFEPDAPPRGGVRGVKASALPSYFKVPNAEKMGLPPADARGLMQVNQRTYARLDSDDVVEVDASEPGRTRLMARWQEVAVRGPELLRGSDGRWSPKADDVDSLTPAELFRRMIPEGQTPWPREHMQGLIDELGLDQATLRGIWDGGSPSSLLSEHMQRYQNLLDLDALPDVLSNDLSPVPHGMQPVIAQALADRTERTIEVYVADSNGAPILKVSYKPSATTVPNASPVKVLDRGGSEYGPLDAGPANQNVPNRLSLIDAVIDAVPTFGVNASLNGVSRDGANQKPVRRGQAVTEVITHIQQERAAFQGMCVRQVSTGAASLDVSTGRPAQVSRAFPSIPADLLQRVSAELGGDGGAGGPFDSGKAGRLVDDHYAEARRHEVLFRLQRGPHTKRSEAAYLNILVSDPAWPKGLTVKVTPVALSTINNAWYPDKNKAIQVYGDASTESRRLQLYRRADGTYMPIASDGWERGRVPSIVSHAPDDLGSAVLQAMTSGERDAWTSAHATSDVNTWVAARARGLDSGALDTRMNRESTALKPVMLSAIAPDSTSLHNRQMRQDGTYEVDGKIYLHAYGLTYRLKAESDRAGHYRVISSGSSESLSPSSSYAGLDFAPLIVRDRQGVWNLDTKDRLWAFHKLGSITKDVDVTQARVVLEITGISAKKLNDIQLGKKAPSPPLGDAITRARMRSVIARLSHDDAHFNDLQDPTPVLALLTKLDGWPKDTAIEVSDQDGQITLYGQPGTTKAVRVALDDLQSPILESLGDLFGTALLGSIIKEPATPSLLGKLGKQLSKVAGAYPHTIFDAWYFKSEVPDSMLSQELMRQQPGLTKHDAGQILSDQKITRKAHLLPDGQLDGNVKIRAQEASQTTRAQRMAEAVRTGRIVTSSQKNTIVDLLNTLPGWDVDLVTHADGDMTLYQGDELRVIRGDGDGYQVLDSDRRVLSKAQDIYAGIWFALTPVDRTKLGLKSSDVDALQTAVWKRAEQDKSIFQRHRETQDETDGGQAILCRVRRTLGEGATGGCVSSAPATVPQAANDAKSAVVASQAALERFVDRLPPNRRPSSTSSSTSGSSVRSGALGTSNFASIRVSKPIKLNNRLDTVKFPKIDETNFSTGTSALVSRSGFSRNNPGFFVLASSYRDADLPKATKERNAFEKLNDYKDGVAVPGRHFKYKVKLGEGNKLELDRPADTEGALLEYVVAQIKQYVGSPFLLPNPNLKGELVVYTELTPCDSCQSIIRQFRTDFPGIKLDVYFSFMRSGERGLTPLADADLYLWT
jgi:The  BURPS668_1122 family of deaminases